MQVPSDEVRDLPKRDALFGNTVIRSARRPVLQRQPEQPHGIVSVHGGPAVLTVPDVSRFFLLPRSLDQPHSKAVIADTMNDRR